MANRFPLILDTSAGNLIKELQAGDNLDLRENSIVNVQNINSVGTINAAVITVNGQKVVAQSFKDLTDTPNTFVGSENYFVKVNETGSGIEFAPLGTIGTIGVDSITTTGNILPQATGVGTVGNASYKWAQVVSQDLRGDLSAFDGSTVFDATTGKISYAALQGAPSFLSEFTDDIGYLRTTDLNAQIEGLFDEGNAFATDIKGSVFGDDSTLLVDGTNGIIYGNIQTSQATITALTGTQINTTAVSAVSITGFNSDLNIAGGDSTYDVVIGDANQTQTKDVLIYNAKLENTEIGTGLGIAEYNATTDLQFAAGNRIKIKDAPFKLAALTTVQRDLIVALEGDLIYNTTDSRVQMYQGSAWKDVNGNVEATAGTSNFNDVVIAGDLTITGDTTEIETTNTTITDNVIVLNKGETAAGVTLGTSGIEVERGTVANKTFVWDEATDKWTLGTETLVAATFEGNLTGDVTGDTQGTHTGAVVGDVTGNAAGAHTGTFDGEVTGSVFGDDSTVLVDGNNNKVVGDIETASLRTSESKIALGEDAGQTSQGTASIAIGSGAGQTTQGYSSVAMGDSAGQTTQGNNAVALGRRAQFTGGGDGAVGIGYNAGYTGQGASAVAIGYDAGRTNQAANSIVINATGVAVENNTVSSFVVKPIRNAASANVMMYDDASGEVTHTATPGTLAADIDKSAIVIGAATATTIDIGNAGSTTTVNGTVQFTSALIANNLTADDSISILTSGNTANEAISIGPQGSNTAINLTADSLRFNGVVTTTINATGGVVGDLQGSIYADDSTLMIDSVNGQVTGDVSSNLVRTPVIRNLASGTNIDVRADGFLNLYGSDSDVTGVSNIQMDTQGINYIELKTEPTTPGDVADVAKIAINAFTAAGDVQIGTEGASSRNQSVDIYNATVTGTLIGNVVGTLSGSISGDVVGSVYGDDSSQIIDGVAGKIVGPISRIVGDVQQISGPGDISLETLVTEITTTGTDDAYTLADGVLGQVKIIAMVGDAGDAIVTPTTLATGNDITFSDVNDNITLLFTSNGWLNTANQNATIA